MDHETTTYSPEAHANFKSYLIGFILSLLLTLASYLTVSEKLLSGQSLVIVLMGLALIQLTVQSVFFLHLGKESKPYWNLLCFLFMVQVILIIVIGSLWIMANLNENVMPSMHMTTDMQHQKVM